MERRISDPSVTGTLGVNYLFYKGEIDCSSNPNYPAAEVGHVYKVSVGGKIGGPSGVDVEPKDLLLCTTTSASGDQTTVGANWVVIKSDNQTIVLNFGSSGKKLKTRWLDLNSGTISSAITGHRVWKTCILSVISVQTGSTCSATFKIYKNLTVEISSITLSSEIGKHGFFTVALAEGDQLSCLMEVSVGTVNNPNVNIEILM